MKLPYKATQYLWAALKVLVLATVLFFIYNRLMQEEATTWEHLFYSFTIPSATLFLHLGIVFILWVFNWFFEIKKWEALVEEIHPISFKQATIETLSSFTVGQISPAKLGEYGIRPLYYKAAFQKKILFFTFLSNGAQMMMTLLFGVVGCFILLCFIGTLSLLYYVLLAIGMALLAVLLLLLFKNKKIKGYSIQDATTFFKKLRTKTKWNLLLFSGMKYGCFSLLFYVFLCFYGSPPGFYPTFFLITAMYLLSSIAPTFILFDVVIKGGVALWVFSFIEIPEPVVLATVVSMWLLNFVIPSLLGSYFVSILKPKAI